MKDVNAVYRARQDARLKAKIAGRNSVNAAAREWTPRILAALPPWIGKKIQNQSGCLADKFTRTLPQFPNTTALSVSVRASWGLTATFRTCASCTVDGESACSYEEAQVYLGEMGGLNLTKVLEFNPDHYRTDYTEAEIKAARVQLRAASDAVDSARSKLCGFGEHDNN